MEVKFKKLTDTAIIPTKATDGSAGYDLYIDYDGVTPVEPHTTVMFSTGIAIEIPKGCFGAIYPRSGVSSKLGLRLSNCVGVVDSDYRGNIGLPIHNDSYRIHYVEPHMRIAQIVFQKYEDVQLVEVEELSDTERGTGGFGSTGTT